MAESHESQLSRAISQVDLAAALISLPKEEEHIVKCTQEELLALRPVSKRNGEHVEIADIGFLIPDGVTTPPNFTSPAPPPPTPASPGSNPDECTQALNDNTNGRVTSRSGAEQKKKKKNSHGKDKKPAPTGFEGSCFYSLLKCLLLTSSLRVLCRPSHRTR
jgi:hypothetical protein